MKQIIYALMLINTLYSAEAEFNPENHDFSKISDIQKWIHPTLNTPEILQKMQNIIATEMAQNPSVLNKEGTVYRVQNNDGDTRFYGKTFPVIAPVQKKFLKAVKKEIQLSKKPTIVEMGAATGAFSYKIACAMENEGTLIVNDLSTYEIEKAIILFKQRSNIIPLTNNNVIFDAGDGKQLLERCPELEGKVDFIYVQNVEHFMNPIEHQVFAETVLRMLAPDGQIFSVAHTIPTGCGQKGNPFFEAYITLKKQNVSYPMFLKTNIIQYQLTKYKNMQAFLPENKLQKVERPSHDEICGSKASNGGIVYKEHNGSLVECCIINQKNCLNYFTPKIYEQAYKKAAENLGMQVSKEAGGFMNRAGGFLH